MSVSSLHRSVVQPTLSSQLTGFPSSQSFTALHVSTPLQWRPSSQAASLTAFTHSSSSSSHESIVHSTSSSQSTTVPGVQTLATQVSSPSQKTLLSQSPLVVQPKQRSSSSSHWRSGQGSVPAPQPVDGLQISTPVQKSPSLHSSLSGVKSQ